MSKINSIIKSLIPTPVKRSVMEGYRSSGKIPAQSLRNLMAYDGEFTVEVEGKPLKLMHTKRWIEDDVFWKGAAGYEPASVAIWLALAKHANTIIDIGANTGLYSLFAKRVNTASTVYAFEPLPMFRETLLKNCEINGFDIKVMPYAVSNFEGPATFYVPEFNQGNVYASSLNLEHYKAHQDTKPNEVNVQVKIFDQWAQAEGAKNIDLVKIDAEGHDALVLQGMKKIIDRDHPDFLIEVQSDAIASEMMQMLTPQYYAYFEINDKRGVHRVDAIRQSDDFNFFVCKHETAQKITIPGLAS